MTTRITKSIAGTYTAQGEGACDEPILTFQECFQAAAKLIGSADGRHSFINHTISDSSHPAGCSVAAEPSSKTVVHVYFNKAKTSSTKCAAGAQIVTGTTAWGSVNSPPVVQVSVTLNASSQLAEITLQGNASVWFGVGFGAHAMGDLPWTVVVDGKGEVSERKLANHLPGSVLKASVQTISNSVDRESGLRTVVLTRPLKGVSEDYFTFSVAQEDATIPIILAVGSGPEFAFHKDKAPTTITLLPVDQEGAAGSCVCPQEPKPFGQATGQLLYHRVANQSADVGTGAVGFGAHKCANWPHTDLINNTNPTCDIRYYRGGQWSCHHMW